MHKVMLTCFTRNTGALRMYQRLGYSRDETSPDPAVDGPAFAGCDPLTAPCCSAVPLGLIPYPSVHKA